MHKTAENSSDETAKAVMFFDLLRSPYMFKGFTTIQNLFQKCFDLIRRLFMLL